MAYLYCRAVPFSDADVEAAVRRLEEPGRLDAAQRTVAEQAPALQRILNQALEDADWFGSAHRDAVRQATESEDVETAVRTLIAEETRVAMLIGAAVGLELANQLQNPQEE
jgi:hypothetical protein